MFSDAVNQGLSPLAKLLEPLTGFGFPFAIFGGWDGRRVKAAKDRRT